jgi:tetratricopeptide (TPR) repeat protein
MIFRLALLALLTWSFVASAQKETTKDRFDRGMVFFNLQDYPAAIIEIKAAYLADPSKSEYLFTLAQAQRLSGDCAAAIGSYKAFLRTSSGKSSAATEALIHTCEKDLKAAAEKTVAEKAALERAAAEKAEEDQRKADEARRLSSPATTTAAEKERVTSVVKAPPLSGPVLEVHHAWYADGLGAGLVIPGVLGLGAGAVFLALGNGEVRSSMTAATQAEHDQLVATGQPKQVVGVIALSAGVALAAGGIIRYLFSGGHDDSKPSANIVPLQGGAAAVISGAF